jgi:hypothetical protein
LKSEATFQNELGTGERLSASYSDSWQNIETDIVDDPSGGGGVGTATSKMSLVASKETERLLSCADTGNAPETLERLLRNDSVEDGTLNFWRGSSCRSKQEGSLCSAR